MMKYIFIAIPLLIGATSLLPVAIYDSWWWSALWLLLLVITCAVIIRQRLFRRPLLFLLHISMVLIMAGGVVTHFTSTRGTMHLSPGKSADKFRLTDGTECRLPFSVTLERFETEYYPGASFPSDFHSHITDSQSRRHHISMNKIARIDGYRFYQSGFDGKGGSTLSVTHDPWGIGITYAGYLLFTLSGLLTFLPRTARNKPALAALLALLSAGTATAAPGVTPEESENAESVQGICCGRVMTFASAARMFTLKTTGSDHVSSLTSTQFVLSLLAWPEQWKSVSFIKIDNKKLADALGIDSSYISPSRLYDNKGTYLPSKLYKNGEGPLDSDILKLDEKTALLASLYQGTFFKPLDMMPVAERPSPRSRFSINCELLYLKIQPLKLLFIFCFISALICGIAAIRSRSAHTRVWIIPGVTVVAGISAFLMTWNSEGTIPLSSTWHIMQFTAVCMLAVSVLTLRHTPMLLGLASLMAGTVALVAWIGSKNPQLTPLMPVLASPWLSLHVSLVMLSYAILALTFPAALAGLISKSHTRLCVGIVKKFLWPGVYLLGLGIITGAMWANVSWGRYWAWDPKETWALTTMLLYAVALHSRLRFTQRGLLLYVALCILSMLMTYFGVNLLPSLHAYA